MFHMAGTSLRAEGTFGAFRNMLAQCDLFDLKHTGISLSWRGKRRDHLVYCRLDRTLINPAWSDSFPTGRCHYLGFEGSDHRPVITVFDSAQRKRKRLFRYDRRLRDNEAVKQLIAEVWGAPEDASVNTRLAMCRRAICTWTREHYFNSKEEIKRLKEHLDMAMSDPRGNDNQIAFLNQKLMAAYKAEEEFWRQRSRIMWLSSGDKNTGYFHAMAKGRRARNRMTVLEDTTGTAYYEEEQIADQIAKYFANIYSSDNTDNTLTTTTEIVGMAITPTISELTNEKICSVPDSAEVKNALFLIHPDKAPVPMGSRRVSFTPIGALSGQL